MKRILPIIAIALALCVGCKEEKSPLDAQARADGEHAAAALIAVDRTDTFGMERSVIDAKCKQSVYAIKRDSLAVRAFDEAFKAYLKKNDKALFDNMFPDIEEEK